MAYPKMYAIRQTFSREREEDVQGAVLREFEKVRPQLVVKPGARVAVTVGSRGIRNIAVIARATVDALKGIGAQPFIFPAMGSHAGGTAEGQASVLHHYGVTEAAMGCPILASMAAIEIGRSKEGLPVFLDKHASEADHVVVLNRVKPHTEFKGEIESGIMKMMLIGMGKHEGAKIYHRAFADYGFDQIVESLAPIVISKAKVLFALAVIENGYEETALIRASLPQEIVPSERGLLRKAKELAPKLPFDLIDVLIVDEIGKNISGAGMDTNVIGRFMNIVAREPERPKIKRIYVRDLTPESMGNASGIGLADFTHRRVINKMDVAVTNTNCLTAVNPEKARIPIFSETDREALELCFGTIGLTPAEDARVMRIRNTLHIGEVDVSETLVREAAGRADITVLSGPIALEVDAAGELEPMLGLGSGAAAHLGRAGSPIT